MPTHLDGANSDMAQHFSQPKKVYISSVLNNSPAKDTVPVLVL